MNDWKQSNTTTEVKNRRTGELSRQDGEVLFLEDALSTSKVGLFSFLKADVRFWRPVEMASLRPMITPQNVSETDISLIKQQITERMATANRLAIIVVSGSDKQIKAAFGFGLRTRIGWPECESVKFGRDPVQLDMLKACGLTPTILLAMVNTKIAKLS